MPVNNATDAMGSSYMVWVNALIELIMLSTCSNSGYYRRVPAKLATQPK